MSVLQHMEGDLNKVPKPSSDSTQPLEISHGGQPKQEKMWKKVFDLQEAKTQILFSLPMILTNLCYISINIVSIMFAGHLGQLELAGATLGFSWATVTGFASMIGLSGALETLCGQGFGADLYGMLGIFLQASCIISFFCAIFITFIWLYSEPILILLHQDPNIAKKAALYVKYLIPQIFAYGFHINILKFLQTQSFVRPLVVFSLLTSVIHFGIVYVLVHCTPLGFKGAPLASSISLMISALMLATYVIRAKKFERTWKGFSLQAFHHILPNLKLALPSAAMVCLEYWAFEILVLLAGLMPNSERSTSLIAICLNTQTIAYMIVCGLGAAISTRVSNELGAGYPDRAKRAMAVTLMLSVVATLLIVLALALGHNIWAGFFSNNAVILKSYASMTPLLAVSIMLECLLGALGGVARGCGWQHLVVCVDLATLYCIGMPIACLLGFKLKLHAKGLWIGLVCGLSCHAGALLLITKCTKWKRVKLSVNSDQENAVLA